MQPMEAIPMHKPAPFKPFFSLLAVSAAVLLASCSMVPPYERPAAPIATHDIHAMDRIPPWLGAMLGCILYLAVLPLSGPQQAYASIRTIFLHGKSLSRACVLEKY